jgi:hypothetical protein
MSNLRVKGFIPCFTFLSLYKCGKLMNVGLNGDLLVETVVFVGVKIGFDLF